MKRRIYKIKQGRKKETLHQNKSRNKIQKWYLRSDLEEETNSVIFRWISLKLSGPKYSILTSRLIKCCKIGVFTLLNGLNKWHVASLSVHQWINLNNVTKHVFYQPGDLITELISADIIDFYVLKMPLLHQYKKVSIPLGDILC